MKRKVVQHGPATLTVSLPAAWARRHAIGRGDELTLSYSGKMLCVSPRGEKPSRHAQLRITGMRDLIPLALSAIYRAGYDEITVRYGAPGELEAIHRLIGTEYIGLEIVEEDMERVRVKDVSASDDQELSALLRRILGLLVSCADEGLRAARGRDARAYEALAVRETHVRRLADFCRRALHKRGQHEYASDAALYCVIEQLERLSSSYAQLHRALALSGAQGRGALRLLEGANRLLHAYEELFFAFTPEGAHAFLRSCGALADATAAARGRAQRSQEAAMLEAVARDLCALLPATMTLHL